MSLKNKKIILGITGSIAAYKAILLVRLLKKEGALVRIVMTKAAERFVSPLVLSTFSQNNVWIEFDESNNWNNHVELGLWGDLFIIAPASCNTISKMSLGICDNILVATYLSARCPVILAPAMDEDMYVHPSTQVALEKLRSYGNIVLSVNEGELASGLIGKGRMLEPEEIIQYVKENTFRGKQFSNKKVLITAGPTYELIDPVRYISNFSTGKMGVCLAEEFYLQGADVTLITGPIQVTINIKGLKVIHVQTAAEMEQACLSEMKNVDIIIMSAAVADYTPIEKAKEKIKKKGDLLSVSLQKTTDILAKLGQMKKEDQLLIGFALETENEEFNAIEKMKNKNTDYIVLNSLREKGAGFGLDTNKVSIFSKTGSKFALELKSKVEISKEIIQIIFN
jgi:phosphopantothenoylcysteine decarboxylase/phosphopantothenate--cysteine ligase